MVNRLQIDSVIKSFTEKELLTDIYLSCETGDILALIGRNGVGKSTLLKILFGTMSSERKFIKINERVLNKPFLEKDLVAYLPQDNFLPQLSRLQSLLQLFEIAPDSLAQDIHLSKHQEARVAELSGGELRYLEIWLLLHSKAQFVLLDEPFNGVSPLMTEDIIRLIQSCSRSKGIILTDHDYRNVFKVANRFCLLVDGGIKTIKNKDELVRFGYLPDL